MFLVQVLLQDGIGRFEFRQHGQHAFAARLQLAHQAIPLRAALRIDADPVAQPARQFAQQDDGLVRRLGAQMEFQRIRHFRAQMVHHHARLLFAIAEETEGAARLFQIVQQALVFARTHGFLDLAVALGIVADLRRQAAARRLDAVLDLFHQRQHVFQTAELFIIQIAIQLVAHDFLDVVEHFAAALADAVFRRVGRGILVAHGVAFQVFHGVAHLRRPFAAVETRADIVDARVDPVFHAGQQVAVPVFQQFVDDAEIDEVAAGALQFDALVGKLGEIAERRALQEHIGSQEIIALRIGGAVGARIRAAHAKERLQHGAGPAVGPLVARRFLARIEHGHAERGKALREIQAHVAEAVLRHGRVVQRILVLRLVDGDRALGARKVGRGEILEQRVGHHVVDVADILGVLLGKVARIDQVHLAVRLARQFRAVVGIPAAHIALVAHHRRFQLHQRRIAVGLDPVLVGLGVAGRQEQHQLDVGRAHFAARQPARQQAHVEEGTGTRATGDGANDDDAETVRFHAQTQFGQLALVRQACLQGFQFQTDLVADLRVLVEEIQARDGADLAGAAAHVETQFADALRRQGQPFLDVRIFLQGVFIAAVLVHVERFDHLVVIRELHLVELQVLRLRLAAFDHGAIIEVEMDELRDGKVGQALDARALARAAPQGVEDAPAHAHQHLHARAADADEQGRAQFDDLVLLALAGAAGDGLIQVLCHDDSFDDAYDGVRLSGGSM